MAFHCSEEEEAAPVVPPIQDVSAKPDTNQYPMEFNAGQLYERLVVGICSHRKNLSTGIGEKVSCRYSRSGALDREAFVRMAKDLNLPLPSGPALDSHGFLSPRSEFDAGVLFERYDNNRSGVLEKDEFQRLMCDLGLLAHPERWSMNGAVSVPPQLPGYRQRMQFPWDQRGMRNYHPVYGTSNESAYYPPASEYPLYNVTNTLQQPQHSGGDESDPFEMGRTFAQYADNSSDGISRAQFRSFVHQVRKQRPTTSQQWKSQSHYPEVGSGYPWESQRPQQPTLGPWAPSPPPGYVAPAQYGEGSTIYSSAHRTMPQTTLQGYGPVFDQTSSSPDDLYRTFTSRVQSLQSAVSSLLSKRENMTYHMSKIKSKQSEISERRASIEREIMADVEAMLHRLRSAEAHKQSVLQHEMDSVAGDISAIDNFSQEFAKLAFAPTSVENQSELVHRLADPQTTSEELKNNPPPTNKLLQFMRAYPGLCSEADRLVNKDWERETDDVSSELPNELKERMELIKKAKALEELNQNKNSVIEALVRERESATEDVASMSNASASELQEWMRLTDRLTNELRRYQRREHLGGDEAILPPRYTVGEYGNNSNNSAPSSSYPMSYSHGKSFAVGTAADMPSRTKQYSTTSKPPTPPGSRASTVDEERAKSGSYGESAQVYQAEASRIATEAAATLSSSEGSNMQVQEASDVEATETI